MVPLAGLVDVAFLGHLTELRHLGGVALATIIFNYLYWTFGFLRMGTTGLTAQAVGREDEETVGLILLRHGAIALTLGSLILISQYPLRELGFWFLNPSADLTAAGRAFFNGRIWDAPVTLLNFVVLGWLLGRSRSTTVLLLSIVSNGTNVILDYLFIVRWGWESSGAGLATALSQYAMTLVALLVIGRELWATVQRAKWAEVWEWSALRSLLSLSRDILIRTFFLLSVFATFTNLSAQLGTTLLAANTLLLQLLTFSAHFIDGFAFATESVAGILYGRGDINQLRAIIRLAGGSSLVTGVLFALGLILFPTTILGWLTDHQAVLDQTAQYMGWFLPLLGFGAIAYMLDGYFLGITASQILRNASIVSALGGFLPFALLSWYFHSGHLLWLALSSFMVARCITLGYNIGPTLRPTIEQQTPYVTPPMLSLDPE
ncbi:MAG: MATE family efflux transporter [Cyanothece sp. SIO2G6]|nr:MATE family efflux transporter [Cyanothece sp. SIO2G6]